MIAKTIIAILLSASSALAKVESSRYGAEDRREYGHEGQSKAEYLESEDVYVSGNPEIVYIPNTYIPEERVKERELDVKYIIKGPKDEGLLTFPHEYAKYEALSEGPNVPEMRPKNVYAEVFEKRFICPKFEKVVVIKVPAKCACEPLLIRPKFVKPPRSKEQGYTKNEYYGNDAYSSMEYAHPKEVYANGKGFYGNEAYGNKY